MQQTFDMTVAPHRALFVFVVVNLLRWFTLMAKGFAREKMPDTVVGDMAPQLACDHHLSARWQVQHLVWLVHDL